VRFIYKRVWDADQAEDDSPNVPFVVPAMPRRITLTFSVHAP
jgi:hypothetical protein